MTLKFGLYVTATPIGNLGDISARALEIMQGVDAILCEDTRTTSKLLNHYGIKKPLTPYHEHNADRLRPEILKRLEKGETLALVSDAGTPLISDPGYKLVRQAQEQGIPVIPIPGASATMAALMASGLPTNSFHFAGFLPSKAGKRDAALEALKDVPATLVFFESPGRVVKTVSAMAEVFGPEREAVLARELTKIYEEILRLPLGQLQKNLAARKSIKGEIVLLVEGGQGGPTVSDYDEVLKALLETMSVGDAAAALSKLLGKPRKEIYSRALVLKS